MPKKANRKSSGREILSKVSDITGITTFLGAISWGSLISIVILRS